MEERTNESWPVVLDEVTGALDVLTVALDSAEDLEALLSLVCEQVTQAVPGVTDATITLLTEGRPHTVAGTGEHVVELDAIQYAQGDGPCLRASRTGDVVRVAITDITDLWPVYAQRSAEAGFGSFLSAPMPVDGVHSGAINCYAADQRGFAELDGKLLDLYTSATTAALRVYCRYLQARETSEQLRAALANRAVIDQAKGILMALRQISADEAFTLLVEQSQRENVKVRDLAVQFVARTTGTAPVE
ncbi:GAF and ANTAR domain-containing protein [Actinosynnema sp. NPDC050436]|uniref:GAF and ANTAR domain-containing protein n=1 Tax=Actinosynnema sp. NPDC050436 TaxID=3155659 RepID=UPI0033E4177D